MRRAMGLGRGFCVRSQESLTDAAHWLEEGSKARDPCDCKSLGWEAAPEWPCMAWREAGAMACLLKG